MNAIHCGLSIKCGSRFGHQDMRNEESWDRGRNCGSETVDAETEKRVISWFVVVLRRMDWKQLLPDLPLVSPSDSNAWRFVQLDEDRFSGRHNILCLYHLLHIKQPFESIYQNKNKRNKYRNSHLIGLSTPQSSIVSAHKTEQQDASISSSTSSPNRLPTRRTNNSRSPSSQPTPPVSLLSSIHLPHTIIYQHTDDSTLTQDIDPERLEPLDWFFSLQHENGQQILRKHRRKGERHILKVQQYFLPTSARPSSTSTAPRSNKVTLSSLTSFSTSSSLRLNPLLLLSRLSLYSFQELFHFFTRPILHLSSFSMPFRYDTIL